MTRQRLATYAAVGIAALLIACGGPTPEGGDLGEPPVEVPTAEATSARPVPRGPLDKVPDGTRPVGMGNGNVKPGTYQIDDAPDTCYWEVRKGTSTDIVQNGNGPGQLRVTLKEGQTFESRSCGTWGRIGS
jgi:hypothetical protein